jgi:hypothetical protein
VRRPAPNSGQVIIQYWLYGCSQYGCPSPFSPPFTGSADCVYTTNGPTVSLSGVVTLNYDILLNLASAPVTLYGKATSSLDTSEFCYSSNCWASTGSDYLGLSSDKWGSSEWNLFGNGGGSEANFFPPFSMNITVNSYVKISVSCYNQTFTGESNNMTLGGCKNSGGQFVFSQSG